MGGAIKMAAAVAAVVGLAACANSDLVDTWDSHHVFPKDHAARSEAALASVDWATAETRDVLILERDMRPAFVNLKTGQPYVLRVVNTENVTRSFAAPDFFRHAAVAGLEGRDAEGGPRIISFALAPRQSREVRVVPMDPGRYRFSNESGGVYIPWAETFTASQGAYAAQVGVLVVND